MPAHERARRIDWSLYVVTDACLLRGPGVVQVVESALRGGARVIQYREKRASTREMVETARELVRVCRERGGILLVNDRVDVAWAAGADGVHLGQDDLPAESAREMLGPERLVGVTVHDLKELREAERAGADHVSIAPVFATSTKPDHQAPKGVQGVADLVKQTRLPAVTIGGIDRGNAADVMYSGVRGVCVVSAIMAADDPERAARELLAAIRSVKR